MNAESGLGDETTGCPPPSHSTQVMSVCAHENMNMIAVGFQNGTVIVIRGNITRDRMSRVRIVHEEKGERVYVTGNNNLLQ